MRTKTYVTGLIASAAGVAMLAGSAWAEELTIATVNNADMIIMQKLSPEWEKATGNKLNWVVLEENVLRQRVTTDIATKSGQFDIMTIGGYETPIWGKAGWLLAVDDLGDDYDYDDLIKPVRAGLTVDGKLYAVPFYAESSFTLYRKDLFEAAGLKMPDAPTYAEIKEFATKLTDKSKEQYGLCLRGKPGWGENMAYLSTLVNTFGGSWFDESWKPQMSSDTWKKAINYYVDLMKEAGPPESPRTASMKIRRCSPPAIAPCGSTPPRLRAASTIRSRARLPTRSPSPRRPSK